MKISKQQLEADLRTVQASESILHCALNDLLNGKVTWFRKGAQKVGVSRPDSPCGGLVIHQFNAVTITHSADGKEVRRPNSYACAYRWEDWYPQIRDNFSQDKEIMDLREAAYEANSWMNQHQTANS